MNFHKNVVAARIKFDIYSSYHTFSRKTPYRDIHSDLKKWGINDYAGVYVLCKGDEVVYVGQTQNLGKRIKYHDNPNKDWDTARIIPMTKDILNALEYCLISKYAPVHNSMVHNYETESWA